MLLYQIIRFLQSSILILFPQFILQKNKGKTISEQIEELQCENTRLKNLEKLFDKMVKTALGMDLKSIRKILENHSSFKDNFIKKIADFYGLETEADYQDFLDTFCTNEFINHYNSVENPESDN